MATDERDTNQNVQSEILGTDASEKIKSGGSLTTSEIVRMINLFKKPYKKRAGKFQPFKKFFGKRKKRDAASDHEEAKLKPSYSFGNVFNGTLSSDEETNNGLRFSSYSMGTRAFSHDSIFIPDGQAESEQAVQAMSQDSKVRTLQQQLSKTIKFGQPSQITNSERTVEEVNVHSEEDILLSSPMETETQQDTVLSDSDNKLRATLDSLTSKSLPGTGHEGEEKVTPVKSSRPKRHLSSAGTIESINLDAIPQAVTRLDNSAAKHKLSIKPKKQRMSRKHRGLTKDLQSITVTEYDQENLETHQYTERCSDDNGHVATAKPTQNREGQKQLELADEKRKQEDHWRMLKGEEKRQMTEAEEKKHLDEQRCKEVEEIQREQERRHCEEEKRKHLLEEERYLKIGEQKHQEEEKRRLENWRIKELEEQKRQEEQRQQELEEQQKKQEEFRQQELKEQKRLKERRQEELEEQKRVEERRREELEEQKRVEERRREELEEQKRVEERRREELEEQKRQELEEQKRVEERRREELGEQKRVEERRREELEEQKRVEEWRQQELEEQKRQELEEQKRQELEEQKRQEERRRQELEEQKRVEEQRHRELEEQKRQELEEQKRLEEWRRQDLEEQKRKELDEQRQQELEEQKRKELEEQRYQEIQKLHLEEEKRHGEQKRQELEKQREELEKRHRQAEEKLQQEEEVKRLDEQSQHQKDKKKRLEAKTMQEPEKQRRQEQQRHESAEQTYLDTEVRAHQEKRQEESNEQELGEQEEMHMDRQKHLAKQKEQEQNLRQQQNEVCSGEAGRESMEKQLQEESNQQKTNQSQKGKETVEGKQTPEQKREVETWEQERIGKELRWQEVDERQAMHRPFTFQVSSGEKQIIFQKVNLSPVIPAKETVHHSALKESKAHKSSKGSHALPSSMCVPHTAILVTGAQLCGTAVNLNQIKDTACKSLLGLTEEKKPTDIPPPENTQKTTLEPKLSHSKMKHTQETLNNQDILAEWACIRSRILKNAENSKLNEKDRVSFCRHSDDWTPRGRGASHGNLRKTLSANAKFSITPAWQKFSETSKTSADAEHASGTEGTKPENTRKITDSTSDANGDVAAHMESTTCKGNAVAVAMKSEIHLEIADNTDGYKFAKDLPSFLVPSLCHSPGKELSQSESLASLESQQKSGTRKLDKVASNEDENVSPFGIKLRRTNYSLRFHYDQQAEQKKKKRYSAGDSFDGLLTPLVTTESVKETINTALTDNTSPSVEKMDGTFNVLKDSSDNVLGNSHATAIPLHPSSNSLIPLPIHEKPVCKSSLQQKPALAPKPANQTPPSSPLSKINRSNLVGTLGQRVAKAESDGSWKKDESKVNTVLSSALNENQNEEEETREKKSFFPSITIPWRNGERADRKPEPLKKEKPVLQSRHSLDGSKLMEKVESAQPLWITLALQKQKGFREQQATREERRQAREAKQAEKLAKENAAASSQSDNRSSNASKTSILQKLTPQEDEKKTEMAVSRLDRREQLKKSNTLPTSVTVEISDSVPSTPLAKEVTKRFSTPDANPVSTEPAWLALAKRKAKAWSDCPQIIK